MPRGVRVGVINLTLTRSETVRVVPLRSAAALRRPDGPTPLSLADSYSFVTMLQQSQSVPFILGQGRPCAVRRSRLNVNARPCRYWQHPTMMPPQATMSATCLLHALPWTVRVTNAQATRQSESSSSPPRALKLTSQRATAASATVHCLTWISIKTKLLFPMKTS